MALLVMDDVRKCYPGQMHDVLRGVSLRLRAGRLCALMGPSGCGKSTLLHLAGGMEKADAGNITFQPEGEPPLELTTATDEQLTVYRRRQIGFVFQFFNLLASLTLEENVLLPLRLNQTRDAEGKARHWLNAVGLCKRLSAYPSELSGGEMQRVAIARALAHTPKLVLADEPTGNLDSENSDEVLTLLVKLCREVDTAILMATHSQEVASRADDMLVMRDGQILAREVIHSATAGV